MATVKGFEEARVLPWHLCWSPAVVKRVQLRVQYVRCDSRMKSQMEGCLIDRISWSPVSFLSLLVS